MTPVIRCAIYTRKSSEEGLSQAFNSLEAQREAAEAYIKSQREQGWVVVPERYDDGGFTGGNMDRPALCRLLADLDAGAIDCVVVYKVDRLSRSLLDFARIIDRFEQRSVSFVSVTQQFNTSMSLGRLTLNILLSFAQFEREIISERTRDKMSAARRKGKWMGGIPVLGYDVSPEGRQLIVNQPEADQVLGIYDLYRQYRSAVKVVEQVNRLGWTTKRWRSEKGTVFGGNAFTANTVVNLLRNRVYTGHVRYQGQVYEGEHKPLIEQSVWDEVNATLPPVEVRRPQRQASGALLQKLLRCGACEEAMMPTFTNKRSRRYTYYVCRSAQQKGWAACPTKAVAADLVEGFVLDRLRELGAKPDLAREAFDRFQAETDASRRNASIGAGCPESVGREGWMRAFARFHFFADTFTGDDQVSVLQTMVQVISYNGVTRRVRIGLQPSLEAFCVWMAEYEERYVRKSQGREAAIDRA